MPVIGVIDLKGGQAVHARGGARDRYAPVVVPGKDRGYHGDAVALATFYVRERGVPELYVADLDAIAGGEPQHAAIERLAALGVPLWLDAATAGPERALDLRRRGIARIVVGLETIPAMAALRPICAAVGGHAVAFSLDLRDGRPLPAGDGWTGDPAEVAGRAVAAGAGALIVLDLARVGRGTGLDLDLLSRLRATVPAVTMLAGGGIADARSLQAVIAAGCDGVLVASALIDGRLTAADVHQASSRR